MPIGKLKAATSPAIKWAKTKPTKSPSGEPISASRSASIRIANVIWRRAAPIVRNTPISRRRWATVMLNEFRIRNAPTNAAIAAKKSRIESNAVSCVSMELLFCAGGVIERFGGNSLCSRCCTVVTPTLRDTATSISL